MLTKQDLGQIRTVVREEVKDEVSTQLRPLKRDVRKIRKDLTPTLPTLL